MLSKSYNFCKIIKSSKFVNTAANGINIINKHDDDHFYTKNKNVIKRQNKRQFDIYSSELFRFRRLEDATAMPFYGDLILKVGLYPDTVITTDPFEPNVFMTNILDLSYPRFIFNKTTVKDLNLKVNNHYLNAAILCNNYQGISLAIHNNININNISIDITSISPTIFKYILDYGYKPNRIICFDAINNNRVDIIEILHEYKLLHKLLDTHFIINTNNVNEKTLTYLRIIGYKSVM